MGKRSKKNRKQSRSAAKGPKAERAAPVATPAPTVADDARVPRELAAPTPAEEIARQVAAAVVEQIAAIAETRDEPESGSQQIARRDDEQRRSPRVSLAVDIDFGSESHFFAGLSGDLSEGGVFVETYRDMPVGSEVALEFSLPNGDVRAHGSVRWHRGASDSSPPGLGIAFDHVSREDKELIHAFCKQRAPLYYEVDAAS